MKIIFLLFILSLSACGIPMINQQQQNCANMNMFADPLDATFNRNELCGTVNNGVTSGANSGFLGL